MSGTSEELMLVILVPNHHRKPLLRMLKVFLHLLNLLRLIFNCCRGVRLSGSCSVRLVKISCFWARPVDNTALCCGRSSSSVRPRNGKRAVSLVCFLLLEDQVISGLEFTEGLLRLLDVALQGTFLLCRLRCMLNMRRRSNLAS